MIKDEIRTIQDFPKEGVTFYDITSIMMNPKLFERVLYLMQLQVEHDVTSICAIDARGFLFAAPIANRLQLPLLLARKKGKLPGRVISKRYDLEYGTADIEVHKDDIPRNQKVVIIDDVLATGGTVQATRDLLEEEGVHVSKIIGVLGLPELGYREKLKSTPVYVIEDVNES